MRASAYLIAWAGWLLWAGAPAAAEVPAAKEAASKAPVADAPPRVEKPAIGPAPGWVRHVDPAPAPKADDAPFRILLQDQQVSLTRDARTIYSHGAFKVQTAQGLSMGNVTFAWNPETDTPVVHKLVVVRDGKPIDVLASQSFTVVRRETNLENAMLDGVLTATLQPEGLQTGDVVDFEMSMTTRNPVLAGHAEAVAAGWNGLAFARVHFRAQWPADLPVRVRTAPGLPTPVEARADGLRTIEIAADDLMPLPAPSGAPLRFALLRTIELSDYKDWAALSALMAPLYARAAVVPPAGPLHDELERIRAASPDPVARAEAALALVQDRVRYVFQGMNSGDYVPAGAEVTWSRRFGDCKGKTALLVALLHGLGIEAVPVLVHTQAGDALNDRLPMAALFDHILVRATIAGRSYWLDGTRTGDRSLARIRVPNAGYGLPVQAKGATLVRMLPPPLDRADSSTSIRIDASAGITLPAPIHVETLLRGDEALSAQIGMAALTPEMRDRSLREYWRGQFNFVDVDKVSASWDAASGEERFSMDGKATLDWKDGWYETDQTGLGFKADFHREPGPNTDAPYAVAYPTFGESRETIVLPPSFAAGRAVKPAAVDRTIAGVRYRRDITVAGDAVTIATSTQSLQPEFPAADAPATQAALRKLADDAVYLRRPNWYVPSDTELAEMMKATPEDAKAYIDRGNLLLDRGRWAEAAADYTRALALEPRNEWALADRALAFAGQDKLDEAKKDAAAAQAVNPRNPIAYRALGRIAMAESAYPQAIAAFTTAQDIKPGDAWSLTQRAYAYQAAGDIDHALADMATVLKADPKAAYAYRYRINLLRGRDPKAMFDEIAAMVSADPEDSYTHVFAARAYAAGGRQDDAMRELDRALAIKPEAYIYLNRQDIRAKEDIAARRADLDAAAKLDPAMPEVIAAQAQLLDDTGDHKAAVASWTRLIAKDPVNTFALTKRGISYALDHQDALAEKDFGAARTATKEPALLNNMCWTKATAGVALASALDDCDAALKLRPQEAGFLDSRGLVLLRLGHLDDAIAEYDRALAKEPKISSSLFGRALAHARRGEAERARADAAAAEKVDPNVRKRFGDFGLTL